ncbi:MAG: helix-turn-helix transcriptional regulator [Planctomycetes bacterium]|nr:helix-turn-helix transcriptional regulator [Planctomycetota bacterium]
MQKRPSRAGRVRSARYQPLYAPLILAKDFPFWPTMHVQKDEPITTLHQHDGIEIGYCFSGSGIFVVEDKVMPFSAGCATVINERELHLAQSTPGTESRWAFLYFDPARLVGATEEPLLLASSDLCGRDFPNVLTPDAQPAICALVRGLAEEARTPGDGHRSAIRGLVLALMAQLHRLPGRRAIDSLERAPSLERLAPALAYIGSHYAEAVGIPALARVCAMSGTHFRRSFHAAMGQSPKEYLTRFRVQKAAALLRDPRHSVLDVSLSSGFQSLSAFNRHFRAHMKASPREWRQSPSSG